MGSTEKPLTRKILYSYLPVIKAIYKEKNPSDRARLLNRIDNESINFICSCVRKMISGHIKISKRTNDKLKNKLLSKTKKKFKSMSEDENDIVFKRKILRQEGSGFASLLSALIPALISGFSTDKPRKNKKLKIEK